MSDIQRARLVALVVLAIPLCARAQETARFDLPRDTLLVDQNIPIVLSGLQSRRRVNIRVSGVFAAARWTAGATFAADDRGRVDLASAKPIAGSYRDADPMGLFWSARPEAGGLRAMPATVPAPWQLVAEIDGRTVATDTVWRRALSPDVRVTRITDSGFTGTLYEPPGGRHPAVIVLPGSNGGTPPPTATPGGLASRGYVVLSLAYFADEGLPPQLSNIPLEYFQRAIEWLRTRESVDPERIALHGTSRGGELALLLGATYPALIHAVVAVVPSSVLWPGCCAPVSRRGPAWTLGGVPLPHMPTQQDLPARGRAGRMAGRPGQRNEPPQRFGRLSDRAAVERAAIRVERIAGPVLLISGRADQLWPSDEMADQVMARLRRNEFRHAYRHASYENAGHAIARPYTSTMNVNENVGGTPAGTARAREQYWTELLAFLELHLRSRGGPEQLPPGLPRPGVAHVERAVEGTHALERARHGERARIDRTESR